MPHNTIRVRHRVTGLPGHIAATELNANGTISDLAWVWAVGTKSCASGYANGNWERIEEGS